jgi:phage terminase small subunit
MAKKPNKKKTPSKKKSAKPKKAQLIDDYVETRDPWRQDMRKLLLTPPEELTGPVEGHGQCVAKGNIEQCTLKENYISVGAVSPTGTKFTTKERMFISCYVTNRFNGTQAAKDAGYDCTNENTFASIASENLRKPHIKAEIDRIVNEKLMSREEVLMNLSNMARGSLNDYLHVVRKPVRPIIKKSLRVCIEDIKAKMEDQEKFIERAKIQDKKRLEAFAGNVIAWTEQIIEYEIELERNPGAYREERGEEIIEEVVELDLKRLMEDKERGRIKSFKPDKNGGFEVELYGADGALRDIGRFHGIFEKDKEPPPAVQVNFANFSTKDLNTLLSLQKKARTNG